MEPTRHEISFAGSLRGHNGWVTQIATSSVPSDFIISSSRDKQLIVWKLTNERENFGVPHKALKGHDHFVSDVVLSSDGQFALSGSWDKTLRLWDLTTGKSTKRFVGHTKDILNVAFSADNRQIVSGSRDNTINLWNTLGACKFTFRENGHTDWVSCVKFSPQLPMIVSCSWDKTVKVWDLSYCKLKTTHYGHTGYLNTIAVSPDGSLCASGGRDGNVVLWDLNAVKKLHVLESKETINALVFCPTRFWLCAAIGSSIKIWDRARAIYKEFCRIGGVLMTTGLFLDLETKKPIEDLKAQVISNRSMKTDKPPILPDCISLTWSKDGQHLFAGYTDNIIRIWKVHV